ncbi:carbohydrate kinase family protein [Kribbella sp. NPDC023855]|uniref:carbohydrate kinase family protein n=1 Tax=Kribbella sp. NPDC023855 TaxID=3154698 RepID=UPI0033D1BF93
MSRPRRSLVCIGDLVEDVVVWVGGVTRGGTDNPARIQRVRGGAAASVAVFASSLGTSVRFVGRVGDDLAGEALVGELVRAGVEPKVQRQGRTGAIVILVDGSGERTMFPDRAAAAELAEVPDSWISGFEAYNLSAYSLTGPSWPVLRRASEIAQANQAILTIDAASVALMDSVGPAAFRAMISTLQPTYIFANAAEAATGSLQNLVGPGTTLVVKNGAEPTEIHADGNKTATIRPDPVDDVRDTTGAGDAFASGFLAAVLDNAEPVEAVAAGHNLARRVLTQPGAVLTTDEQGVVRDR